MFVCFVFSDWPIKVLGMVRFPLMDAGLLSDVIKNHEVTQVRFGTVRFVAAGAGRR